MSARPRGDVPHPHPDDRSTLEETLDVLSDPDALEEIREADAARARGDVVRGVEAVRALRSGPTHSF